MTAREKPLTQRHNCYRLSRKCDGRAGTLEKQKRSPRIRKGRESERKERGTTIRNKQKHEIMSLRYDQTKKMWKSKSGDATKNKHNGGWEKLKQESRNISRESGTLWS